MDSRSTQGDERTPANTFLYKDWPRKEELSFWELHKLLAECHEAELATARAQRGALQVSANHSPTLRRSGSGAGDDEEAIAQGHRLQQVLLENPDDLVRCTVLPKRGEDAQSALSFSPRFCWLPDPGGWHNPRRISTTMEQPQAVDHHELLRLGRSHGVEARSRMLSPVRPFKMVWDSFSILWMLMESILVPLAFLDDFLGARYEQVLLIFNLFWTADTFITLRTGVFLKGVLNYNQWEVLKKNAKGWLVLDVTYVLVGWLLASGASVSMLQPGVLEALRILRLFRVKHMLEPFTSQVTPLD